MYFKKNLSRINEEAKEAVEMPEKWIFKFFIFNKALNYLLNVY
jgi:hypothetical protein